MKKLQELIEIISPNRLKGLEILGRSDTLIDKLYHLIRSGEVTTNEEALLKLYKNANAKTALYQTKEKLYQKLLDSIFIIDQNEKNYKEFDIAYADQLKSAAVFEWLSRRGGQNNIIPLGNKLIKTAIKYNQADLVVRVSKILARKYVIINGDEKLLDYYHELYEKYQKLEDLNTLAQYYWYKVSVKFNKKNVLINSDLAQTAKRYADEIEANLLPDHRCLTFIYLVMLRIRKLEIEHDYESVIPKVDEALLLLKNYPDVNSGAYNGLITKKLSALITLRRYKEAKIAAYENLRYLREGSKSWFTLLDNIVILNFYEKKYSEAYEVYLIAVNHSGFDFLTDSRKENYKLYRAYLQFFINIGLADYPDQETKKKPLRYAKFNNEVHIFTSDKKGINITFIVAQFLLLFTEEKYMLAYEKIESIKSYTRKHLRADETFRSNCFLNLLVKLVECDFHKAATVRKTKTLYEKLKNHPPNAKRLRADVEIVPYEDLWEIILEHIDNSFRGVFNSRKVKKIMKTK